MIYLRVAIKNAAPDFDRLYVYKYTNGNEPIHPGSSVTVEFGRRKDVEAVVVEVFDDFVSDAGYEIKEIVSVVRSDTILTPEMLRILVWMKKRYFCSYYDILRLMLPLYLPSGKKSMRTAILAIDSDTARDIINSNEFNNIKYIRVMENLIENHFVLVSELCAAASVSQSVIKTLEKKGILKIENKVYDRIPGIMDIKGDDAIPKLNPDQEKIVSDITSKLGKYSQQLIYGVTGSGKTEIYLRLIEKTVSRGEKALVLVPEIALTPGMLASLKGRFGDDITMIHSRMSAGQRHDSWMRAYEGKASIVVGARSAIFAPLTGLGLIIIDEEHEFSYKSEFSPKYNAKEIARKRAEANDAVLVYGSATPLIESYYRAKATDSLHVLNRRALSSGMPRVLLADMKQELANGNNSNFSPLLINEMKDTFQKGQKAMLLVNRRGYFSVLICDDCSCVYKCKNCSVSMKYHKTSDRLICHHCGYTLTTDACSVCGSKKLRGAGYGTQLIEKELKTLFPDIPVFRLDADTQGMFRQDEGVLLQFKKEKAAILTGTQLIAKGHDIEDVTLAGVLLADMMLSTDDFRASERTFSLISQIVGRSGRGRYPGTAVIQSFDTQDYCIKSARENDYVSFFENEIKIRKMLGYPPYMTIGIIELGANDKETIDSVREDVAKAAKQASFGCEVIGPYDPFISMIANRHRSRLLIKGKSLKEVFDAISGFDQTIGKQIRKKGVILSYDIDPYQNLT